MANKSPLILSVNAGSSSLKISVFTSTDRVSEEIDEKLQQLCEIQLSNITSPPASLKYTRGTSKVKSGEQVPKEKVSDQASAFAYILDLLIHDSNLPGLADHSSITHTVHRIVHGGDYPRQQVIDDSTYHHIEALSDLAPLHNGPALSIVRAVAEQLPSATNIAYFDSSFHATIPEHVRTYPIDQTIARKNKLRKYGFHGISYSFITGAVATHLSKPREQVNIIALHLGSGSSACCIRGGASIDTSMGLTPVSGLPGGTRAGSIDPATIFHYTHEAGKLSNKSSEKMHITQAEDILNGSSGFKGLTGTNDFGAISADLDRRENRLAFDLFVDRVLGFVGDYWVKLGGKVDALVFAGGIGEKAVGFREAIINGVECLGLKLDGEKNGRIGDDVVEELGAAESKCKILVVQTDEQLEMARGVDL